MLVLFAIITQFAIFGEHFVFAAACSRLVIVMANHRLPLLVNPFTLFLGKVSYSLYLSQYVAIILLGRWKIYSPFDASVSGAALLNMGINIFAMLLFTAVLAFALYHLVEQPFQNLGRRIIRARRHPSTSVAAATYPLMQTEPS